MADEITPALTVSQRVVYIGTCEHCDRAQQRLRPVEVDNPDYAGSGIGSFAGELRWHMDRGHDGPDPMRHAPYILQAWCSSCIEEGQRRRAQEER